MDGKFKYGYNCFVGHILPSDGTNFQVNIFQKIILINFVNFKYFLIAVHFSKHIFYSVYDCSIPFIAIYFYSEKINIVNLFPRRDSALDRHILDLGV